MTELERCLGHLRDAYDFIKDVENLYTAGFNERNALDCPKKRDETGVTAGQYRRDAGKMLSRKRRLREQLRKFLNKHGA